MVYPSFDDWMPSILDRCHCRGHWAFGTHFAAALFRAINLIVGVKTAFEQFQRH
jgi:hypothetical protein